MTANSRILSTKVGATIWRSTSISYRKTTVHCKAYMTCDFTRLIFLFILSQSALLLAVLPFLLFYFDSISMSWRFCKMGCHPVRINLDFIRLKFNIWKGYSNLKNHIRLYLFIHFCFVSNDCSNDFNNDSWIHQWFWF